MTKEQFVLGIVNYKMEKELENEVCEGDTEVCPDCGKVACMCYEDYLESHENN